MLVTERYNNKAREDALSKLRLITDRIMLRRMKRDHTASMELPPKRSVFLASSVFGIGPDMRSVSSCTTNSSVKSNGTSQRAL